MSDWEAINPFPDSSRGDLPQLGTLERATLDRMWREIVDLQFNNEGEKQMEKIDWHKPLRATNRWSDTEPSVTTFKSGGQRVTWHDDRVYPVDDYGRVTADVAYPGRRAFKRGEQIVENAPEEKFFVGLYRFGNNRYKITDCGQTTTMGVLSSWKRLMADQPHWIVDTRKSAEPPPAVAHDPKDWVALYYDERDESAAVSAHFETESAAREKGDMAVRIRTTPAPVDTSRYIQLWRSTANEPWRINKFDDGRQEFTWAEVGFRAGRSFDYCAVKVRD